MAEPNRRQRRSMKHSLDRAGYGVPINGVSHQSLTSEAFDSLCRTLADNGNVLSEDHRTALFALCGLFTESAQGKRPGRWAFSLPTGMGKTSAVVAWCSALVRLGLDHISVAVSASKIEALVELKLAMMARGVAEDRIGLLYVPNGTPYALPPTAANDDRQIMLVAHNRVRMTEGHDLFMSYRRKRRDLMIWDESLLASDAHGVSVRELNGAIGYLEGIWRGTEDDGTRLVDWLKSSRDQIEGALSRSKGDVAVTLTLPELDDASLATLRAKLPRQTVMTPVADLLDFSREELRALPTGEHGAVWYQVAVPREIQNIIILDASYPIRRLVQVDTTIHDAEKYLDPIKRIGKRLSQLKSYNDVTLHQLFSGGGRETMQRDFSAMTERKAVREVVDVVKALPPEEAALIFVFKDRHGEGINYKSAMLRGLSAAGIDTDATVPAVVDGKPVRLPRINVATWGQETSLNRWAHCSNVILCGVLQRSSLDLAASYIGQSDNLREDVSTTTVKELARSEVAHVVYQALSRGSCRVMHDGQAKPMKGWIIHRDNGIQPLLSSVMPGVRWAQWEARHLVDPEGRQPGVTASTTARIVEHLKGLPQSVDRISTRQLKADAGLREVHPRTFTDAVRLVPDHVPWLLVGRSLERAFEEEPHT